MKSKYLLVAILFLLGTSVVRAATPVITSFSPGSGPVGTLVTITGTNLTSPTVFTIGGVAAIVISNTGTQLVGLVMPGAVTGAIAVTSAGGTGNSQTNFTITARPNVNMIQSTGNGALEGSNLAIDQGVSVAISADGKTTAVGGTGPGSTNPYVCYVFTFSADIWTLQASLETSQATISTGTAVALSADGNTLLMGEQWSNATVQGTAGGLYVYTRSGTEWTQQGGVLLGTGATTASAEQGFSVALSADGNTAVSGSVVDNTDIGATWVFTRSGGVWTQQGGKLVGTGAIGGSAQGYSVAISADGNTLITGGANDNAENGAAWIFSRSGGVWTQQGSKLYGSGAITTNGVQQGTCVALSADGNTALVGGPGDNNGVGAAWVYARSGSVWAQQGNKLLATGASGPYPAFGFGVALSADGNLALVGAIRDYNAAATAELGATWEFSRTGSIWAQLGNKLAGVSGVSGNQDQGLSVALSSDGLTAITGADFYNSGQGGAYVFTTRPPIAITVAATAITPATATINGTIDEQLAAGPYTLPNANLAATTVIMLYSTSPTLANPTTATITTGTNPLPGGTTETAFASALTGLSPFTTYYFDISGVNTYGSSTGSILSFTTTAAALLPVTITFPALTSQVYGSADVTPEATSTNTVTPITYASTNTAVATITQTGTIHIVGAGATQITASQAGNTIYSAATPVTQPFTVTPASLTITANNQSITAGSPIPVLTASYSGFVNGDTQGSLTGLPTLSTSVTPASTTGTYPIVASGAVDPNYTIIDDILNIKNIENYPKNKLALVNRDGIMIYQASGYNNTTTAFDGHSNITGALQQQGTLLYILEYWANGQYHRKTGFTVLRY